MLVWNFLDNELINQLITCTSYRGAFAPKNDNKNKNKNKNNNKINSIRSLRLTFIDRNYNNNINNNNNKNNINNNNNNNNINNKINNKSILINHLNQPFESAI